MAGHSRSNNGVASLAYVVPAISRALYVPCRDARAGFTLGLAKGRTRVPGHDAAKSHGALDVAFAALATTSFGVL
jgi:hypothetical protein